MYEPHLTEVLLMDVKLKLCVWTLARKAVIATEYKAAHFLMVFFFLFNIVVFLSFSNNIEPKGHFIDHSEVVSSVVRLLSLT